MKISKYLLLASPLLFLSGCGSLFNSTPTPVSQTQVVVQPKHKQCNKRNIIDYENHCMEPFLNEKYKVKYDMWEDCTKRASDMFCD
jgi:outer membrane biogenesis lipoprotein LolB